MTYMKLLMLAALVIAFGVAPTAALGKSCVRIDIASRAYMGQPIRAKVPTFAPRWANGKLTRLVPVGGLSIDRSSDTRSLRLACSQLRFSSSVPLETQAAWPVPGEHEYLAPDGDELGVRPARMRTAGPPDLQ